MQHAIIGETPNVTIDFEKAIFSRGELLNSIVKDVITLHGALLHIKWDDALLSAFCKADDQASFVVYNPVQRKFVIFENVIERAAKEVMLQLPPKFKGDTLHCWMGYVNTQGDMVSTTTYLGTITTE